MKGREPRRLESGNFKREGQSFAEQVDAEIVHCGYRITRDIVPCFLPSPQTLTEGVRSDEERREGERKIARSFDEQRERERECTYKDRISWRLFVDAGAYATAFLETLQPGLVCRTASRKVMQRIFRVFAKHPCEACAGRVDARRRAPGTR